MNATNHSTHTTPRRVIVLGSTGSIGVNTLQVIEHLNASCDMSLEVVGLAAGRNTKTLIEQAKQFQVREVSIADESLANEVQNALPGVTVHAGKESAFALVESLEATDLVAAMVGAAGLPATLRAIEKKMNIHLANKETLIAAGALVQPAVEKHGVALLPVDSEHSAIFQCLHDHPTQCVKRIVLTASGGPFREADKQTILNATVEQALNHPTWDMGRKITIDSASMMNKALEIIEAHWLFNLPGEQIDVIVHPQSIVHSFVEFADHSVLAQLGPPDMRTPIQYALTYPARSSGCSDAMDWAGLSSLTFEQADHDRFPSLAMAYQVIKAGGTAGAIFNAANEIAVEAFLNREIRFGDIFSLVQQAIETLPTTPIDTLETVLHADEQTRDWVREQIRSKVSIA